MAVDEGEMKSLPAGHDSDAWVTYRKAKKKLRKEEKGDGKERKSAASEGDGGE